MCHSWVRYALEHAWCRCAIGYGLSVVVGHFVVRYSVRGLWRALGKMPHNPGLDKILARRWALSGMVGVVERLIYTASFVAGGWEVIGAWLVLKVAAKWQKAGEFTGADNVWLIGNGLNLIFSYLGAWIVLLHMPVVVK